MALGSGGAGRAAAATVAVLLVSLPPLAAQTPPRLTMQGPAEKTAASATTP